MKNSQTLKNKQLSRIHEADCSSKLYQKYKRHAFVPIFEIFTIVFPPQGCISYVQKNNYFI